MMTTNKAAQWLGALSLVALSSLSYSQTLIPDTVFDQGGAHANYPASNAADGSTAWSTRWAAQLGGDALNLVYEYDSAVTVDDVAVAWGRGDERGYTFEVYGRPGTSGTWTQLLRADSSGSTESLETYNVTDMSARQIRLKVLRNTAGADYANVNEFEVYGPNGRTTSNSGSGGTPTSSITGPTVTVMFEKNNTSFSIDGNGGAQQGQQIYLWNTNTNNANQHWDETQIDNNYYQYKKFGTSLCWDADDGGARNQAVRLETCDVNDRNQHWEKISLSNGTVRLKKRGVSFSLDGNNGAAQRQVIYLWNSANSNVNQQWTRSVVGGTGPIDPGDGEFGLDPSKEPWENFDLSDWVIDTPAFASDGESERYGELDWDDISNESRAFFYTHTDGGMRFSTRLDGAKTSTNTSYVRSELREMLRAGNTSVSTTGVNDNNWALGYQPSGSGWGGRNGVLSATLKVNKVTTSGSGIHVGRTIIGQIHADNDEPARLYYRKPVGDQRGCVYLSHEIRDGDDVDFDIVGSESCNNPSNGIELDELFSYQIINDGAEIRVVVRRGDHDGDIIGQTSLNMNDLNSGYDRSDEWMYFKAGAYTQNNTGNDSDGDIITFYRLSNTHDNN